MALFAVSAVMPPGTGAQVALSDSRTATATALEQAMIEHACSKTAAAGAATDPYRECLNAQLTSLRADFGRDLNRLSGSERKALDSACGSTLAAVGREAYLECLGTQLVSLRNRRSRASPAASQATVLPLPSETVVPAVSLTVPELETTSWFSSWWIGIAVATLVVAAGAARLAVKARRAAARPCRVCGGTVPGSGDLCPKCRHEAADALRHAATERVDHEKAQEAERRQRSEREEEHRLLKTRQEEETRLRQQEEAGRREEDARRRQKEEEETRQRNRAAVDFEEAFDPLAVLGVPQDASRESIETAYQEARLKYAPERVAHLGPELQEHYKRKADAVDRAYTILTK